MKFKFFIIYRIGKSELRLCYLRDWQLQTYMCPTDDIKRTFRFTLYHIEGKPQAAEAKDFSYCMHYKQLPMQVQKRNSHSKFLLFFGHNYAHKPFLMREGQVMNLWTTPIQNILLS